MRYFVLVIVVVAAALLLFSATKVSDRDSIRVAAIAKSTDTVRVPIILYHSVREGRHQLNVRPAVFEEQLRYLRDNGYTTITYDQLADYLRHGTALPERPVMLDLDDGWANQYHNALPLLEAYGATATFFISPRLLGVGNYMSWEQVIDVDRRGQVIGAHASGHPWLTRVSAAQLQAEVVGGKRILEEQLGHPVTAFAYPFGAVNNRAKIAVRDAGFTAARGTGHGFTQTRDRIFNLRCLDAPDNIEAFIRLVTVQQ